MPSGEPEIFRSIQGEGVSTGAPCVFVRLATCNLACSWCDTKYTWDWKNHDIQRETMDLRPEDVQQRILTLGAPRVVITGGEPMLQQDELAPLVAAFKSRDIPCEVETNGTIAPDDAMTDTVAQWNVSPKLANSGNRAERREVPTALAAFAILPNAYAKFVITQPSDADEACALAERYGFPPERIILMPEGTSPETLRERGQWLAELCAERGVRFSTRLHILTWGNQRGR
ncbi:MAG: 7-carboxy-7-deazaguanine synthase QueE [Chloroflexi bacterium]|nr:7-carboxy-7-deazaguanine synthase QueE [Chloroflexota bacterium]